MSYLKKNINETNYQKEKLKKQSHLQSHKKKKPRKKSN